MASIEHAHSADTPRGVLLPSADEDSYSEHSFAETDDDREAQAIDAALDSLDALIRRLIYKEILYCRVLRPVTVRLYRFSTASATRMADSR